MPQEHTSLPRARETSISHGSDRSIDWAVAALTMPGQAVSGDLHLVAPFPGGVLVAVVDGLGHGEDAAAAAQIAVASLKHHAHEPVKSLVERCHLALRSTRGVVMTIASFNVRDATMTWLGVGNVEGALLREAAGTRPKREVVLLRGGVVGFQLPPLHAKSLPVEPNDVLLLTTDGIRCPPVEEVSLYSRPQEIADHVLSHCLRHNDDALVLVARYLGDTR